jgi:RNA polymerase sigma-70 factor (ECF subfamily)
MEAALTWDYRMRMVEETVVDVPDSDVRLMLRFQDGDTEAFEQLFSRHTRAVVNFAYRFVRNREMAEELAQEIFLRVFEGAAGYRPQAKFTPWLYRIATNVCLNEIRKPHVHAARRSIASDQPGGGEAIALELTTGSDPSTRLERQAISLALKQALDQIPEKQRIAFILNKYQELSYSEVAEIMAVSEKAVKSLIHRA